MTEREGEESDKCVCLSVAVFFCFWEGTEAGEKREKGKRVGKGFESSKYSERMSG